MSAEDRDSLSDYRLERFLLSELPEAELEALRSKLEVDPDLRERLAILERSNETMHQRYPPEWMSGQIELKLKSRAGGGTKLRTQRSGYRLWAVPLVALVLAVVMVPALFDRVDDSEEFSEELRIKGGEVGPGLLIYRALENGTERLQAGALAQSGDRVQIVYRSGGMPYGAILSVDGRGAFTQHLPLKGEVAVPLVARDTLDFAYELDDAPHWERFYLAVAERRFELEELRTQLARGSSRELSTGIRLFEFTLKKSNP